MSLRLHITALILYKHIYWSYLKEQRNVLEFVNTVIICSSLIQYVQV